MNPRLYPCEFCDTEQQQERKFITVTRSRHGKWYIFENVPAMVCPNCGHRYFDAAAISAMDERMQPHPSEARPVEAWLISLPEA